MSIRVYEPTEKKFNNNGIKALHPLFADTKLLQRNAAVDNLKKRFGENIIARGGKHC